MEVETAPNSYDYLESERHVGPCISCLYEDTLDGLGMCGSCSTRDPELNRVISALLAPDVDSPLPSQ